MTEEVFCTERKFFHCNNSLLRIEGNVGASMKDESHYSSVWIHAPYDGAPEVVATFCTCISGLVGCHHSASLLTHLENAALTPCSALVANFFAALFHISSALDHSPGGKYPSEPFNHFFAALLQKQAFSAESLGILLENQSSCRF